MPIYEYYSPDTNKIYSFLAKTLAQGRTLPQCPDNPAARMKKIVSGFAVGTGRGGEPATPAEAGGHTGGGDDSKLEAAMGAMEREFSHLDENDPKAMARMMRRMADLGGEKLDGPMEEAVRKLEEGADPDSLEEQLGETFGPDAGGDDFSAGGMPPPADGAGGRKRKLRSQAPRRPPVRDPKLYDYE